MGHLSPKVTPLPSFLILFSPLLYCWDGFNTLLTHKVLFQGLILENLT